MLTTLRVKKAHRIITLLVLLTFLTPLAGCTPVDIFQFLRETISGEDIQKSFEDHILGQAEPEGLSSQPGQPVDQGDGKDTGSNLPLKPVHFVNHGNLPYVVVAWTYIPLGATSPETPSDASTVAIPGGNTSAYLSLPLGTYTWCYDWDLGDVDDDGYINYGHAFDDRPLVLDQYASDELDLAVTVDLSASASDWGLPGRCIQPSPNATGMTVFNGNIQNFENDKPGQVVYANIQASAPPDWVSITHSANAVPVNNLWICFVGPGEWIEATTSQPVSSAGVQFFSDFAGTARVLVNGVEIWQGNLMEYKDESKNEIAVYVRFGIYPPEAVTIRVEALNANESWIPVFFFGFDLP